MAYVVPNTTIYLLSNVPLTPDHKDTFYFETEAQQQSYFRSKIAFTFTAQSYQRVNSGTIRLQLAPAQNVYQCNYLMFTNTSHWNGKWFYAFVNEINYINENCAEISYTIDVIQTWFFNYVEDQCLVVRQSPNNDAFGNNLQPESFDCGEFVVNTTDVPQENYDGESGYKYDYIGLLYLDNTQNNDGALFDNIFSGCALYVFRCTSTGITALNNFIDGHIKKTSDGETSYYPDNFVGMYMLPHECFAKNDQPDNGEKFTGTNDSARWHFHVSSHGNTIDGYTPKYKKLLSSPYNFLQVDVGNGQSQTYKYEFFDTPNDIVFQCGANIIAPCNLTLYPIGYKRSGVSYGAEQISTGTYPMCSWSSDAWAAWLGQNSSLPLTTQTSQEIATAHSIVENAPSLTSMINKPFKTGAQAAGILAGISDTARTVYNKIASTVNGNSIGNVNKTTNYDVIQGIAMTNPAYRASDITKGTVYNGSNWYSDENRKRVHFRRMSITREYAERIDAYFDAFGYKLNKITQPLRRARTKYTYVQTRGCEVKGSISAEVQSEIAEIYDGGIRFWNYSTVGDNLGVYDISNNNNI